MNFEEFKQQLMEDLKEALSRRVGTEIAVEENEVHKLQQESYDGIVIRKENESIGVNVDATRLYSDLEQGRAYEDVLHYAVDIAQKGFEDAPKIDISQIMNYEVMKHSLITQLIPVAGNEDIADLNNQLRQHQIEQRKEQQAKKSSMDDMLGGKRKVSSKVGSQSNGLSQASMKAMLSADSAIAQSKVQGSVATKMDGRAGVLEVEIKLDIARGGDVTKKKEELAEVQQKAIVAENAQLDTLTDANKELEEAAKADQQVEKTDDKDSVSNRKEDENIADTEEKVAVAEDVQDKDVVESSTKDAMEIIEVSVPESVTYAHVDVRL